MPPAAIAIKNLTKVYGELTAVDAVTLAVPAGSMVALTGPSGSGKSTLLHLVGAIERADSGTIDVGGTELTTLRRGALARYRQGIGFVFQRYHLLAPLTALDNVIAPTLPYRVAYDRVARGRELLAAVGLEGRENAVPAELSGGQQQRVAVARALMVEPGLLLADEPTGNLDSRTGRQIIDLLVRLRAERGTTVLLATHEQHVAARCDRIVRLMDGAVAEDLDLREGESEAETLARVTALRPL